MIIHTCSYYCERPECIRAQRDELRQKLEQAEKQEPVAFRNTATGAFCTGGFLRKDWAKWQPLYPAPVHASDISQERVDETAKDRHDLTCVCGAVWAGEEMVCSPRKREWVGLTHDEVNSWELPDCPTVFEFAQFVEAKLKEKNHDTR